MEEVKSRGQHFYNLVDFVEFVLEKKGQTDPSLYNEFSKIKHEKKNFKVTFDVIYKTCFSTCLSRMFKSNVLIFKRLHIVIDLLMTLISFLFIMNRIMK